MNIVYASTRGWNVGDDFIRLGCERIMETLCPGHNRLLYDKSPHVRRSNGMTWEQGEFHGNSVGASKHAGLPVDLVVFCGTPANTGAVTENAFRFGAPVIGLALGAPAESIGKKSRSLWASAPVITVRSMGNLAGWRRMCGDRVRFLPCTSILAAGRTRQVEGLNRVALGWKCRGVSNNSLDDARHKQMIDLYRRVMEARPAEYCIVCHHIDELADAMAAFPGVEVRHSYDERGYAGIYGDADFVITPRVHGVGLCAGMGIGGVLLPADGRQDTVDGFLAGRTWELDAILRMMDACAEKSAMLAEHVENTFDEYMDLLEEIV